MWEALWDNFSLKFFWKMFNQSLLSSTYKRLCVLTDFEPDDILALYLLFDNVPRDMETLFIVGEGNMPKDHMCYEFCKTLQLTNCTILQGNMSQKDYPSDMLTLFGPRTQYRNWPKAREQTLSEFDFDSSLVLALKPFFELLDHVEVKRFEKATLALYGSFNLRCMLREKTPAQVENFLNNAFARVILYESYFATGDQNSASEQNFPLVFKMLNENVRFKSLLEAIELWNTHIAEDCADTIADLVPKIKKQLDERAWKKLEKTMMRITRSNAKVLLSVAQSRSQQMVIADFALVAVLLCTEKSESIAEYSAVKFSFDDNNYTRAIPDPESKIILIQKVDIDVLQTEIVQRLTRQTQVTEN